MAVLLQYQNNYENVWIIGLRYFVEVEFMHYLIVCFFSSINKWMKKTDVKKFNIQRALQMRISGNEQKVAVSLLPNLTLPNTTTSHNTRSTLNRDTKRLHCHRKPSSGVSVNFKIPQNIIYYQQNFSGCKWIQWRNNGPKQLKSRSPVLSA